MLSRANWVVLGAAVLLAAAGGWLQHASRLARAPAEVPVVGVGDLRPDLALSGLDGGEHRLSAFRGRRVLLNFWASWCAPCVREMPALARAQARFGASGAQVVGVAMDTPEHARDFLQAHPVPYPILLGRLDRPSTSLQLGNVGEVLPYSVLLDANGRILASHRGPLQDALLEQWLAPPPQR